MEDGQLQTEKAFIVGSYQEQIPADASLLTIEKTRLAGNVQHIAITDLIGTSGEYQYLHRDHLGSIEKITDEAGLEILDLSFNPDGSRRQTDWGADLDQQGLQELLAVQGLTTKRGYTGHEHLDRTGLIHMNGRIYDPTLGRFLSPDPIVQAPTYSQNWNRYSYVFNNPLSFTDPSGFAVADEDEDVDPIDEGQDSSGNMEEVTVVGEPLSSPTILVTTYVIDNNGKMVLANPLDIFLPELSWTSTNEEDEKDEEEEKEECTQNGGCVSITVDANGNNAQKVNTVGGYFEKLKCNSDLCVIRSQTFTSREEIADHQSQNNMRTAVKTTALSLLGGAIGGLGGTALAGGATVKGIFVDTQVGYALQVGDTIIQEIRADFVTAFHNDSGLDNLIITQTIVNSEGIIVERQQGSPGF
ncbi:hypothetical protein BTJ40_10680 [Microbulbifer sp. A4B17]|nr:hypothetical protein BTJ40_10680 [Microbulbifer sp. A4B17]